IGYGDKIDTLYQFDVGAINIPATRTIAHVGSQIRSLQIGPDGRIYVGRATGILDVLDSPNATGTACGYRQSAVDLRPQYDQLGLPNMIDGWFDTSGENCRAPTAALHLRDTTICQGSCLAFTDESVDADSWQWKFEGATP